MMLFDGVDHDAPNAELVVFVDGDGFVCRIGGFQPNGFLTGCFGSHSNVFERKFSVQETDGCVAVFGLKGFIDDKQITIFDAGILHGVAFDTAEKRTGGVAYQLFV